MRKLLFGLILAIATPAIAQNFTLQGGNFQLVGGGAVANGTVTLTLSVTDGSATVCSTAGTAQVTYIFTLDANGNFPAGAQVTGNGAICPAGTFYTAVVKTAGGTNVGSPAVWIVGPSSAYTGSLFPSVTVQPLVTIIGNAIGAFEITGNSGLPSATNTNLWCAGSFGFPILGKCYVGDGAGWEFDLAKRTSSSDTILFKFKDSGEFDLVAGPIVRKNVSVSFSATPTFNALLGNSFSITLTANVTSSTLSNAATGEDIAIEVCQDGTGGRTFVPPTNVKNWVTIPSGANACTTQFFVYDGTNAVGLAQAITTPVSIANGGTGQTSAAAAFNALSPMTTLGDIEYESGANTASRLAGNTTTTKKYLSQTGNGSVSAAPAWAQIAAADLSDGNTGTGTIVHAASPTVTNPKVNTGMANNGTGFQHVRATSCTTPASANGACITTINWPATWADNSYTAVCTVDQSGAAASLQDGSISSKSTTQIQFIIMNLPPSSTAAFGTINCLGVHD